MTCIWSHCGKGVQGGRWGQPPSGAGRRQSLRELGEPGRWGAAVHRLRGGRGLDEMTREGVVATAPRLSLLLREGDSDVAHGDSE